MEGTTSSSGISLQVTTCQGMCSPPKPSRSKVPTPSAQHLPAKSTRSRPQITAKPKLASKDIANIQLNITTKETTEQEEHSDVKSLVKSRISHYQTNVFTESNPQLPASGAATLLSSSKHLANQSRLKYLSNGSSNGKYLNTLEDSVRKDLRASSSSIPLSPKHNASSEKYIAPSQAKPQVTDSPATLQSFHTTTTLSESFYGSVDVTGKTNDDFKSPLRVIPCGMVLCDAQASPVVPAVSSYDNAACCGPLYDPVPVCLAESHDQERIYAEIDTNVIQSQDQPEYLAPSGSNTAPLTLPKEDATSSTNGDQRGLRQVSVEGKSRSKMPRKIPFFKVLLRGKGKEELPNDPVISLEDAEEQHKLGNNTVDCIEKNVSVNYQNSIMIETAESLNLRPLSTRGMENILTTKRPNNKPPPPPAQQQRGSDLEKDGSRRSGLQSIGIRRTSQQEEGSVRCPNSQDRSSSSGSDHSNQCVYQGPRESENLRSNIEKQKFIRDKVGEVKLDNGEVMTMAGILKNGSEKSRKSSLPREEPLPRDSSFKNGRVISVMSQPNANRQSAIHIRQTSVPSDSAFGTGPSSHQPSLRVDDGKIARSRSERSSPTNGVSETPDVAGLNMQSTRKVLSASDFVNLRSKDSDTSSQRSKSAKLSAVDSVQLCFEQINTMNVMTIQQLCTKYQQISQDSHIPDGVHWDDLSLEGKQPLHASAKCVLYSACSKQDPSQTYTVMLSLRKPMKSPTYSPNMFPTTQMEEIQVLPALLPVSLMSQYRPIVDSCSIDGTTPRTSANSKQSDASPIKSKQSQKMQAPTDASKTIAEESNEQVENQLYDQPWHNLLQSDSRALEASYKAGLLKSDQTSQLLNQAVPCFATILPSYGKVESLSEYVKRLTLAGKAVFDMERDILYLLLQVISLIFALHERQLQLESISATELLVITDDGCIPTVFTHMLNVKAVPRSDFNLICEKLQMHLIQLTHFSNILTRSQLFALTEELIQNSHEIDELRTVTTVIKYLLWGPSADELKVIKNVDNRKQALELWLNLARAKLLNRLTFHTMDRLKIYLIGHYLASTSANELMKICNFLKLF